MKKKFLALCTVGIFVATLSTPASALSLNATKKNIILTASAAVQAQNANVPDEKGTVSFGNLESRIRKGNLAVLSLQASLDAQEAFDREKASKSLVDGINMLVEYTWAFPGSASSSNATIEAMRKQLDALNEDDYKETLDMVTKQIQNAIDQVIMGGESLYLSILSYEAALADMQQGLASLEHKLKEMEMRYQLGQVSDLALQQMKTTQQNTKSQAETMKLTLSKMKSSLSFLLGEKIDENLSLSELNTDAKQFSALLAIDYDTALKQTKEKSFALYSANKTLKDAKETWDDAKVSGSSTSYQYKTAEQTYKSAVYTYDSTVKNFELSFKNLYQSITETKLTLSSAEATLRNQEKMYAAAVLKNQQGQISNYQLQTAKDELLSAQSAVTSANIKLFTVYNQYSWAVERGVLG